MKKLLAIIMLGLLISGCSKKDRMDILSCTDPNSATPELFAIGTDFLIVKYKSNQQNQISIDNETNDKIIAIDTNHNLIFTFYKRTKGMIIQFPEPISKTYTLKCEKIN